MGRKIDLMGSEKSKIVKSLSEGCSTLEIAKMLGCDHRTIKRFVANSQQGRKKRVERRRRKLSARDLRRIEHEAARNPLSSSAVIFQNCNLPGVSRSTRCSVLRDMAAVTRPPPEPTDFSKVLWTDEMRVTLDGPDGWARGWISDGHRAPLPLKGGGEVLVWAGIIKDELVGPFRFEDGLQLDSQTYCQFLEDTFFMQWYWKKSATFKKTMIFTQHNSPSHASKYSTAWLASKGLKDEKLMGWLPSSPDLNPIENLWALLKQQIYAEGKVYTSLDSVWEAVVAAAQRVDRQQIKKLTDSMSEVNSTLTLETEAGLGWFCKDDLNQPIAGQ